MTPYVWLDPFKHEAEDVGTAASWGAPLHRWLRSNDITARFTIHAKRFNRFQMENTLLQETLTYKFTAQPFRPFQAFTLYGVDFRIVEEP